MTNVRGGPYIRGALYDSNQSCDMLKLTCQQRRPNMNVVLNEVKKRKREKVMLTPSVFSQTNFFTALSNGTYEEGG